MTTAASGEYRGSDPCSLANAVAIVGDKWSFFVLREALAGATRFSEFRTRLGVATDILSNRLERLVGADIMVRHNYREAGQRARSGYHLTEAGRQLGLTILTLQQWGDEHTPSQIQSSVHAVDADGNRLGAAYLDADGHVVDDSSVHFIRA